MLPAGEIVVVPFHSKGHTFPAIELSRHLASRGLAVTLFLPSQPSSPLHTNIKVVQFSGPPPPPPTASHASSPDPFLPAPPHLHQDTSLEDYFSNRPVETSTPSSSPCPPLLCAVVDVMMSHCIETCTRHGVPVVSFFTSSACAGALEHAVSRLSPEALDSAGTTSLAVPGLPEDMAITAADLCADSPPPHHDTLPPPPRPGHHHHHHHPGVMMPSFRPPPPPPPQGPEAGPLRPPPVRHPAHPPSPLPGPPEPARGPGGGGPPRGLEGTTGSAAILFNTCDELERPFLDYLAREAGGKPVWGVGPLLPAGFWSNPAGSISDQAARPDQEETAVAEGKVRAWLDSKPPASVVYISFGTLVGPAHQELAELAAALEESDRSFIWALQDPAAGPFAGGGFFPEGLSRRVAEDGGRGLVIRGWAPQLLVLSHPSTAAFLTHCGWNSTVEALARGVPMLTWPVKGDQVYNAKLVTNRLRVGLPVRTTDTCVDRRVTKEEVARGIERLMADEGVRDRAVAIRSIFDSGFPRSSGSSIDAFVEFVTQRFKGLRA